MISSWLVLCTIIFEKEGENLHYRIRISSDIIHMPPELVCSVVM